MVCRIGPRFHQCVEQRGFARIGVADQGNIEERCPLPLASLRRTLALHLDQALFGSLDRIVDHPPIQLDLLFPWTASHARTTRLAFEVRPATNQACAQVLQAREFHLQLTFMAAGSLSEDFKNQQRAIIHRHFQMPFEIALLRRTQRLIEEHLLRTMHLRQHTNLIGFATAHKKRSVRRLALACQVRYRLHPCGLGEQGELF